MPNDFLVFNTLTADETRLIHAIRRAARHEVAAVPDFADEPLIARVVLKLKRFVDLLWQDDPFVVDLRPVHNPRPSMFELQFLYALSEVRARQKETVEEILSWWFSPKALAEARIILILVADILDENGFAEQSSDRLRAHMLATTSSRLKTDSAAHLDNRVISLNEVRRAAMTMH